MHTVVWFQVFLSNTNNDMVYDILQTIITSNDYS